MRISFLVVLGLMVAVPAATVAAQDSSACYELEVTGGQWMATTADPEPTSKFDARTPRLQIPARFLVSDSVGRFGGKTTRPISNASSAFPHSRWDRSGNSLDIGWGTGFVGWSGKFERTSEELAWRGSLQRYWDDHLGEPKGWWKYAALIRSVPCPTSFAVAGESSRTSDNV